MTALFGEVDGADMIGARSLEDILKGLADDLVDAPIGLLALRRAVADVLTRATLLGRSLIAQSTKVLSVLRRGSRRHGSSRDLRKQELTKDEEKLLGTSVKGR